MRDLRDILNEGSPNKIGDAARLLHMGEAMALVPRTFRGAVVSNVLVLPEEAKACAVLMAYAVAGTVTGRFTPIAMEGAPATTECAPNAAGNVAFQATDAVTIAEVVYLAFEGPIIEDLIDVDAGGTEQGSLLGNRAAAVILEVESLAGTGTGVFTPAARGTTPGASAAAIAAVPTLIEFAAADAVTQARVRYVAQPGVGDVARAVGVELDAEDKGF